MSKNQLAINIEHLKPDQRKMVLDLITAFAASNENTPKTKAPKAKYSSQSEHDRKRKSQKLTLSEIANSHLSQKSRELDISRAEYVEKLIEKSSGFTPSEAPKRLRNKEKRIRTGIRLLPEFKKVADGYAKAANMRTGQWLSRLIEHDAQKPP